MRSKGHFRTACAVLGALAFAVASSQTVQAGPINVMENFGNFGDQANMSCPIPGSNSTTYVCGAVAAINSFIFLENTYSSIYEPGGNDLLTPNYNAGGNNSPTDATNFATAGFGTYAGYYTRPGGAEEDYIDTLTDWFNNYAPGTTFLNSWFTGSNDYDYSPGIGDMAGELSANEDIEFFLQDANDSFYHVVTLTGLKCTDSNDPTTCTIYYQDPNAPGTNQSAALGISGGVLQFDDVTGSNYQGTVSITAMFSESPVPEPAAFLLFGTGILGLIGFKIRKRAQ
jgi:hypothetical protein